MVLLHFNEIFKNKDCKFFYTFTDFIAIIALTGYWQY